MIFPSLPPWARVHPGLNGQREVHKPQNTDKRSAEKIEIVVTTLELAPNQLAKDLFFKLKGLGPGQTAAGQNAA